MIKDIKNPKIKRRCKYYDKTRINKKLNEGINALTVWCSETSDNILNQHYNYLFENKKQINKNTFEKSVTYQEKQVNEKNEYNTFDVIIQEKHLKKGISYKVIDIISY